MPFSSSRRSSSEVSRFSTFADALPFSRRIAMSAESLAGLVLATLALGYLLFALLKPERL